MCGTSSVDDMFEVLSSPVDIVAATDVCALVSSVYKIPLDLWLWKWLVILYI